MLKRIITAVVIAAVGGVIGYFIGVSQTVSVLVKDYRGDQKKLERLARKRETGESDEEMSKEDALEEMQKQVNDAVSEDDDERRAGAFQ